MSGRIAVLLENKNVIIYGAGGNIGSGVAHAKLDVSAKEIRSAGGSAEVAVVDALDKLAVDA